MCIPNAQQERFTVLPIGNVLAIAPAGCGKTEALARRAQVALSRGDIRPPRAILALTFSNKARDNLAARFGRLIGSNWRQRITVANFHGIGARILRAHGSAIGVPRDLSLPDEHWRRKKRRELGIDYANGESFESALRYAKSGAFDDDEVMRRLEQSGNGLAIEYERALRADRMLDHDDLIRYSAILLQLPAVSRLYRSHFALVLVDEVQDLSEVQYGIARGIGGDSVTYAGDPAQGIYSFAGAQPDSVIAQIRALTPPPCQYGVRRFPSPN